MENKSENQRLANIVEEIAYSKSYADRKKKLAEAYIVSLKKKNSFQPKLRSHVQKKCKKEFDLLEKDSADKRKDIANEMAFETCSTENDFGYYNYFRKVRTDMINYDKNNQKCFFNCAENSTTKTDDEIKSCFNICINNTFTQKEQTYRETYSKIDEFEIEKMI